MADPTTVRLLLFRVGALLGAAEVEDVAEILPRLETTRIPGAMPFVAGLVNVRGTLVTVVTGWRALGQPDGGADAGAAWCCSASRAGVASSASRSTRWWIS